MIKLIASLLLAAASTITFCVSANAEAPMSSQDENGVVYQDIRTGRHLQEEFDDSTLDSNNDPGHYDGPEVTVTPPDGCPSDTEYLRYDNDNDDQNLINQSRHYDRQHSSGK